MQPERNKSLKHYNSFGFDVSAEYFCAAHSDESIVASLQWANARQLPVFVLGGGSNIVLTKNIEGLVISIETDGIHIVDESSDDVQLSIAAGENWHQLVNHCIDSGYFGIENLSLIPGKTGAAPIQNIGAYGVELSECFVRLEALDMRNGERITLQRDDCRFGYRDSIFKRELKQTHVITSVVLRLQKQFSPRLHYGDIEQRLEQSGCDPNNARDVADVICETRRGKLPDPAEIGNAGSFFTNPIVSTAQFALLKAQYPSIVGFPFDDNCNKVAAGWLVEQCGWKGFRRGHVGVHDKQSLVLINNGRGTGEELLVLADEIRASVSEKFGVELQTEPLVLT